MNVTAFAANGTVIGPYTIVGGMRNIDYKLESDVLHIMSDIPLTISNTDINTAATVPITVDADVNADITLAGVNIAPTSAAAIGVSPATGSKANVTITIADGTVNTLKGGKDNTYGYAGLQKNDEYISENEGRPVIKGGTVGNGILAATGDSNGGAGIGGSSGFNGYYTRNGGIDGGNGGIGSNIHINGGVVTATGGTGGAGIGGGKGGHGSFGGDGGFGSNGGNGGVGSNIYINGGDVTATGAIKFAALALVAGATLLLSRKQKI